MFQTFTGKDYLKIDIANNFGANLDKKLWAERITWFDQNEHQLDALVKQAEEPALFYAGVQAWKKTKAGKPSGYPISLDATSSGIQILACLSGDRKAAAICNVIDTGKREDAYTSLYEYMVALLGEDNMRRTDDGTGVRIVPSGPNPSSEATALANEFNRPKIDRKRTKDAIMTAFYGSTAVPKTVFGEGPLLETFYDTMKEKAPGPWEINNTMLAIWDPEVLQHEWVMPDNFHVKIKVMGQVSQTVHFLNEPFEVTYAQNMPIEEGRSLAANTTHSIDGMIVREMQRRCGYNPEKIAQLKDHLNLGLCGKLRNRPEDQMVMLLWEHYQNSGFLSARILDYLDNLNLGLVGVLEIKLLIDSLPAKPFDLITVHDCFRCLPNYGNDLRRQYNNILAELADSEMLAFIVSQILGRKIQVTKLDPDLARDIRETNYALS